MYVPCFLLVSGEHHDWSVIPKRLVKRATIVPSCLVCAGGVRNCVVTRPSCPLTDRLVLYNVKLEPQGDDVSNERSRLGTTPDEECNRVPKFLDFV